ncbi:hypothetical protein BDY19DRAFT_908083 [Irpex rosettiformis]|uniref:Uncharacterized protein n=1 Tax=Irpex rosettiformis TaxID=378272 RepID=A0ACB8TXD1_9APHY|nr:hypothetical protein BDY19DRAFT_908083 [Irpex rosettiformis]
MNFWDLSQFTDNCLHGQSGNRQDSPVVKVTYTKPNASNYHGAYVVLYRASRPTSRGKEYVLEGHARSATKTGGSDALSKAQRLSLASTPSHEETSDPREFQLASAPLVPPSAQGFGVHRHNPLNLKDTTNSFILARMLSTHESVDATVARILLAYRAPLSPCNMNYQDTDQTRNRNTQIPLSTSQNAMYQAQCRLPSEEGPEEKQTEPGQTKHSVSTTTEQIASFPMSSKQEESGWSVDKRIPSKCVFAEWITSRATKPSRARISKLEGRIHVEASGSARFKLFRVAGLAHHMRESQEVSRSYEEMKSRGSQDTTARRV